MNSTTIQFSATSASSSATASGAETPELPDNALADLFQKALQEETPRHGMEKGGTLNGDAYDEPAENSLSDTFSSMFSAMSSMPSPVEDLYAARIEQAAPAGQVMDTETIERLVERILVSAPSEGGHEVRITLGEHTLRGTEIVLQRDADGMLSVVLSTTDAASFQTLVTARSDLQNALEKHESSEVRVIVDQNGAENGDTDRRSRGWFAEEYLES